MNTTNNILIGILIVIVLGLGVWFITSNPAPTTTTTPPPQTTGGTTTGTVAGIPSVNTDAASAVSNSSASVSGRITPNGSQTTYWYEYGTSEALGNNTSEQAIGSGFVNFPTPAYITGLNANTKYFFRLTAKNGFGTVHGDTHSFTTNSSPAIPGSAPTTQTSGSNTVSRTTANVTGQVNPNGADTQYWFEWGTTTDLGSANALQSAGSGSVTASVSVSLSDLQPLTKYYYRLDSQNKYGTVTGSIMSFMTTGPAAPGISTNSTNAATDVAATSATFNGHVNPNGVETKYWFEYGTDSLLGNLIGSGTTQQSAGAGTDNKAVSAPVTGLTKNTTYYFRIVSQNSYGTVRGQAMSFTTKGQ